MVEWTCREEVASLSSSMVTLFSMSLDSALYLTISSSFAFSSVFSSSFFDSASRFWFVSVAMRELSARTSACFFRSHVSAMRARSVRRPARRAKRAAAVAAMAAGRARVGVRAGRGVGGRVWMGP